MKTPLTALIFSVLLAAASPALISSAADPAPAATAPVAPSEAVNTVCPVSGDKIGSDGKPVYVEHHGKKIALCCKACVKKFRENPDKYAALAEKNQSANEGM